MVGVVAFVSQELLEGACGLDQGVGHADVVDVSGAEQQHPGPAALVDQAMDLGGAAPTRAAYGLEEAPPFAPAADRCALTWLASIAAP